MKQQKQRMSRKRTSCVSSGFDSRVEQEGKLTRDTLRNMDVKAPLWKNTEQFESSGTNGTTLPLFEVKVEDVEKRRSLESTSNVSSTKPTKGLNKIKRVAKRESRSFLGKSGKLSSGALRKLKDNSASFFGKSRAASAKSVNSALTNINIDDMVVQSRQDSEDELNILEDMSKEITGSRNLRSCLLATRSESKDPRFFMGRSRGDLSGLQEFLEEIDQEDWTSEEIPEVSTLDDKLSVEQCDKIL